MLKQQAAAKENSTYYEQCHPQVILVDPHEQQQCFMGSPDMVVAPYQNQQGCLYIDHHRQQQLENTNKSLNSQYSQQIYEEAYLANLNLEYYNSTKPQMGMNSSGTLRSHLERDVIKGADQQNLGMESDQLLKHGKRIN